MKSHRDKGKKIEIKIDYKIIKIIKHSLFPKQNYNLLKNGFNLLNIII